MWNVSSLKKLIDKLTSRGASILATRSSKYPHMPLNRREVSVGKVARAGGGGVILAWLGQDSGERNESSSWLSLNIADRQATITSGAMYPERVISESSRLRRSVADKSRLGKAENETRSRVSAERSETRGKSTQERIWEHCRACDRRVEFGIRREAEVCQRREWLLHRLPDLFQKRTRKAKQVDSTYPIVMLEHGEDVIGVPTAWGTVQHNDGQDWPHI
jgi:hypothetical protein